MSKNWKETWDTLDDIGHYDGSIPWYSTWRGRSFGAAMAFISLVGLCFIGSYLSDKQEKQLAATIKTGDKIFLDSASLLDTGLKAIGTYKLIRPINADDINKKHIPLWQKKQLIAHLDTTMAHNRPVMIHCNVALVQEQFYKQNSACFGTFIRRDTVSDEFGSKAYLPQKWYAFKPNLKVCSPNYEMNMPKDYVFVDGTLYVQAPRISLTEAPVFRDKRHTSLTKSNLDSSATKEAAGKNNKHRKSKHKHRHV